MSFALISPVWISTLRKQVEVRASMKENEKNPGFMKTSKNPPLKGKEAILRRPLLGLFILVLVFLLSPILCMAEDIYISQNAAGNDDGSSCASAHSSLWFNTPANWGSGAVKISAGDMVHLCGTISTALWAQGSGSAGAPITVYFEPGASITPLTFCDGNGCLNLVNKSFIIVDGGSTCGYVNHVDTPCNGAIKNTNLNPPSSSFGIVADNCANCEFRNLTIGPLCDPRTGVAAVIKEESKTWGEYQMEALGRSIITSYLTLEVR